MKVRVLASTKVGYKLPLDEAMIFSGHEAGICYMPDTIDSIFAEATEKTQKRVNGTLKSGHHSVFGHIYYNLCFEEIPKILAMILNNEKIYNTSEKSARYTKMKTEGKEKELYEKWLEIYKKKINEIYPEIPDNRAQKLAQENARYLISVFTPATTMGYTADLRQINYIIGWMRDFINNAENTLFNKKLKSVFEEFTNSVSDLDIEGLEDEKNRQLSLLANRKRQEEWGESYSINYRGTFSHLADVQRHRTINYEITIPAKREFYIPTIIRGTELEEEWLKDISSLADNFPQGSLIDINERGTVENFILKCKERLCGCPQLEVALQTKATMDKYLENTKNRNEEIYKYLLPYSKGPRCTFTDYKCTAPCIWGAKNALTRKI